MPSRNWRQFFSYSQKYRNEGVCKKSPTYNFSAEETLNHKMLYKGKKYVHLSLISFNTIIVRQICLGRPTRHNDILSYFLFENLVLVCSLTYAIEPALSLEGALNFREKYWRSVYNYQHEKYLIYNSIEIVIIATLVVLYENIK